MKDVLEYTGYRQYIADYYADKKAKSAFTWQMFAEKAGFSSPVYLKYVSEGRFNLSEEAALRVAAAMSLVEYERDYFCEMVRFDHAKTDDEKKVFFNKMLAIADAHKVKVIEADSYRFFEDWKNPVLRELAPSMPGAKPLALARACRPEITAAEVTESLSFLVKANLLQKDKDGNYVQTEKSVTKNGIMLSQYGDYMIASEETEPGVGWYYTNWLNSLNKNTSIPTVQIGKQIADDFVEVCSRQCRGQATTLSVVDLAELQATVPGELKQFSIDTNEMIQNKEYKAVSQARSKTREFAQSSKIDQIDLVDFAKNMGSDEGKSLAKALQGAVKYNKTGGSISHAYGLSIYFPYQRTNKVNQMVSTYQAIGMDEEYTRCIQEFASLEVSGQVSAGTSLNNYGSGAYASQNLLGSLLGQGGYSSNYSSGGLTELLGGLYGGSSGGSTGSILDLFMGRSMTADTAAEYILNNHFDPSRLVWENGRITLDKEQWDLVTSLEMNVFYNDGNGFIDLGMDNTYESEGNSLLSDYDGTWLSINRQPVAYYYLNTVDDGVNYVITGYVPALLNGERVDLILNFDSEHDGDGYIAGAMKHYADDESYAQAKELIAIGRGDRLQFLCDYFDYDGNYRDTYRLGDPITLGDTVEIANTPVDMSKCRVTFRFTDIYQQSYWTPALK